MNYQLIAIPVISALIGYITNVIAIKLLFWPRKPINLLLFKLHGLLPKRQAEIAISIGELVEEQLLSIDDLFDKINTDEMREKIITIISNVFRDRLHEVMPRIIPDKLVHLIEDSLEKVLRQEAGNFINNVLELGHEYLTQEISVKKIVEDKINDFDLDELEIMIRGVSSTELRFIELLGGILGFIIGIIQVGILLLFPV